MKIIGIDLGTSNCCVSYIDENGTMEIIRDISFSNSITIPSIVNINNDTILVGNEINKSHINYNKNIFHSFKRLIGHSIDDIHTTNLKEILDYKIDSCNNKIVCFDTEDNIHHLEELIFLLLKKIKQLIVNKLNCNEHWNCIVTVPAYFNEPQRQITMNAIHMAELPIIKLLNEPTAASFAYLYHNNVLQQQSFHKKILVIDYGAGTLDLTILEIEKDNTEIENIYCEVLGIYGDNNFGGIDITKKIYKTMFQDSDINLNLKMKICEDMKIMLSSQGDATYYCNELNRTFVYLYEIFLDQLEEFKNKIYSIIDKILEISSMERNDIDEVILVGGSFKIPYFRKQISEYFDKTINQVRVKFSNKEHLLYEDIAVSLGASVYGYFNNMAKDVVLIERLPLSIGIETQNNEIVKLMERNTIIPLTKTKIFTPEKYGQSFVDINIYQGESLFTEHCYFIGTFRLTHIPLNHPSIFVSVKIDNNGLITVRAADKRNNTSTEIKIESSTSALSEEQINEIIVGYEGMMVDEELYKRVIHNFYTLIGFVDKISYQLNYNSTLELTEDVKEIIKRDIELIINRMDNAFIVKKYNINTNLIQKCIIINDLEWHQNELIELSNNQIEQYDKLLIQLRHYLVDRYDIYLLSEDEDDIVAKNQIADLETLDDNDKNIDKSYHDTKSYVDEKKENDMSTNIKNILGICSDKEDYENLKKYLLENIEDFGINNDGMKILLDKLNEEINVDNVGINYKILLDEINDLCIYLKNSY